MTLHNATQFEAGYNLGLEKSGHHCLVVVAKATFSMPKNIEEEATLKPKEEQLEVFNADVHTGEAGESAVLYENDFAPFKAKCDVILNGSAYAYPHKEVTSQIVELRLGDINKSFKVLGERVWEDGFLGLKGSSPKPFNKQFISYDIAYGGFDFNPKYSSENEENYVSYLPNPIGRGYAPFKSDSELYGELLAQTEEIGISATYVKGKKYKPQSFGVVARHWYPRYTLGGTYDEDWIENVRPFLPKDFNEEYYQSAPKEQQIAYIEGGELVELKGLTSDGRRVFKLPKLEVAMEVIRSNGEREQLTPVVDTLILEPDEERFIMVSRAKIKLKRSLHEIDTVIVGVPDEFWEKQRLYGECYTREVHEKMKQEEKEEEDG